MAGFNDLIGGLVNNDLIRGTVKNVGYAIPGVNSLVAMADNADISNAINDPNVDLIPGVGSNEQNRRDSAVSPQQVLGAFDFNGSSGGLNVGGGSTQGGAGQPTGGGGLVGGGGGGGTAVNTQLENLLRDASQSVNRQYDNVISAFEKQTGFAQQDRDALLNQINSLFGIQSGTLDSQLQNQQGKIENARGQVEIRQKRSFSDLESNMRNLLDAGGRQLGALGAADSSAASQYQYAVQRIGNQQRGQILQQANDLYNQINMKESDILTAFDSERNKLEQWKAQNLSNIESDYRAKLSQIQAQMAGANAEREAELRNYATQIRSQAIGSIQQVSTNAGSYLQQLQQAAAQQAQALTQAKNQLMTQANQFALGENFDVDPGTGAFTGTAFNGGLSYDNMGSQSPYMVGQVSRRRDNAGL